MCSRQLFVSYIATRQFMFQGITSHLPREQDLLSLNSIPVFQCQRSHNLIHQICFDTEVEAVYDCVI